MAAARSRSTESLIYLSQTIKKNRNPFLQKGIQTLKMRP